MKWSYLVFLFPLIFFQKKSCAQGSYIPFNEQMYHWLDRFDILYSNPTQIHFGVKGISRKEIAEMLHKIDTSGQELNHTNLVNMQWLMNESNEWHQSDKSSENRKVYIDSSKTFFTYIDDGRKTRLKYARSSKNVLRHFYRTPAQFFEVDRGDFKLRINPLLNFRVAGTNTNETLFENQRGISIRGVIDTKVYFQTSVLESQALYPGYVSDFRRKFFAVPGAGFYKSYNSVIFDSRGGVDFLLANAYVGTSISRHVNVELGHGRHFLGHGIRSLFLSDFSPEYFYLKLNTKIWRFHYQNIFGELIERRLTGRDELLPKKYFATHYLSLNITPRFYVGLFESVVFARQNQFELQYLNPVILYRTVEGAIGSPDNVLIGLDLKYNVLKKASLYTQFLLDEFKLGEVRARSGWWANKFAMQVGAKVIDLFGISHLDLQLEYNAVRPYTYSHDYREAHYSNYNQALAHPLGSNFNEGLFRLRYQPTPKWYVIVRGNIISRGEDIDTLNYGSNILLPNETRVRDKGNIIGQGQLQNISSLGVDISYEIKQGLFVDLFYQSRTLTNEPPPLSSSTGNSYFGSGIRWNVGRRWNEF